MKASSLFKAFDFGKIVKSANSAVSTFNKAIPVYKQLTPVVKNVRSAFNSVKSVKKASADAIIKDIKAFERPISHFKNSTLTRSNIDNLTFFN